MIEKIKQRLKSKTYLVALVGGILTAIEVQSGVILGWLSPELRPYAVILWPMAMMTLREVTSAALSDK